MEIVGTYGCPYEDYDGQVLELELELDESDSIAVGGTIVIPMMDGTSIEREVKMLEPKYAGDFAVVSKKAAQRVASGEYGTSKNPVLSLDGPLPRCIAIVLDVPIREVYTEEHVRAREFHEKRSKMVCLTPFMELFLGKESIHDWVTDGYSVPEKVIAYLKTTEPDIMSPGIYEHPFKPGIRLLGPYCYTDGHFWWDRDAWKYVVKYHVRLPQEFVDYVMSGKGDEFLESHTPDDSSWFNHIEDDYGDTPHGNFLPQDAGNLNLEDF